MLMYNIFQSAYFYNVIPENPIVLASPNETIRRGSRYLSMVHKQLPTYDRALNTRAQAHRFLFRHVIEYAAELTPERDIADNGRLRIAQRVYSLNENKSSPIATVNVVRLRKISLRIILLRRCAFLSFLFSFSFPLFIHTRPGEVPSVVAMVRNTVIFRKNMFNLIRDIVSRYSE